ncbi:GdmH protein [Streptococcus anginosus 1_2_62CV]|uniref:YdcF family protein n=1 Tax=Streptococcus anginosus TaxID=1328 RepID=UPI0001F6017A|nr:YdcF family protein [Streptococcus anginosus]EFW07688.1 GdmH protein [Streptococcus anginosus 1_2_62CV]
MVLHLIWLLPALLFLALFYIEPRRLFNAYLLGIVLILFAAIVSGLFVIHMEQLVNRNLAMLSLLILALFIPLSVIISTIYLIFNGRQMMTFEGRRLANLLSLFYGFAIALSLALTFFFPHFIVLRKMLSITNGLLIYGSYLYVTYIIYGFVYNTFPVIKHPDYIIILGSGLIGDKVPPLLAQRLEKGKTMYEKFHNHPKIVVSGGQGVDEPITEAEAMAQYLRQVCIPQEDIIIEQQSTNTLENLQFSKTILDQKSKENYYCLVVTNSFHSLRAGIYMRKLGIKGRSIGSRTALYFLPSAWIRETIGLIVLYWKWHAIFLGLYFIVWLTNLF